MKKDNYNTWTKQDFLNNLWERSTGKKFPIVKKLPSYSNLKKEVEEFVKECDTLCNNRLIMGSFRYGRMKNKSIDRPYIKSALERIDRFYKDSNYEHLIDAINILKLKFCVGMKNGGKFESIDRKD